jgi:hypothetical protein
MIEFRNGDDEYQDWLDKNPDGYVINIQRNHNPSDARVHRARCRTINSQNAKGRRLVGTYVKVCAKESQELDQWALDTVGRLIQRCGTCRPADAPGAVSATPKSRGGKATKAPRPQAAAEAEVRHEIAEPARDSAVVQAWADDYIRFGRLPAWQKRLREQIRVGCSRLGPSSSEVLHATFFGDKHPKADVENLVLYNIDSFKTSGRNGIRFEHGAPQPGDPEYRFGYRYALTERGDSFTHWQKVDTLATFGWTGLGAFTGEKKLAQVWWAVSHGKAEVFGSAEAGRPFGVRVEIRPPYGREPVWGGLVKGIFDGVICAFQIHTETAVPPEVLDLLVKHVGEQPEDREASPGKIERALRDPKRDVLGGVPRLVAPYRSGVKWDPSDHFCVAGELLAVEAQPGDSGWEIKGEIVALSSRNAGSRRPR